MIFTVTASEDLPAGAHVSLLFHDSNKIYARKTAADEFPDALAARDIRKGDVLFFDTGRSTSDLARPKGIHSIF